LHSAKGGVHIRHGALSNKGVRHSSLTTGSAWLARTLTLGQQQDVALGLWRWIWRWFGLVAEMSTRSCLIYIFCCARERLRMSNEQRLRELFAQLLCLRERERRTRFSRIVCHSLGLSALSLPPPLPRSLPETLSLSLSPTPSHDQSLRAPSTNFSQEFLLHTIFVLVGSASATNLVDRYKH